MDQKKVGGFLKELRKEKGITQEKLAEKLNVSARSISRWETGSNMPDISLLVDIADFYDVDVREIIEGEKKSEMMNSDIREVATKMADYAETEKSTLLKTIRLVGIFGIVALTIATFVQCIHYDANESSIGALFAILASFGALVAMAVLILYVNGLLQKLVKKKAFTTMVKVLLIILLVVSVKFVFNFLLILGVIALETISPADKLSGLENYNKSEIVKENRGDLDSEFMIFPDSTDKILEGEYASNLKTGLFDTDGYIVLKAKYNAEDYNAEVERLSGIDFDGEKVFYDIKYDDTTYNYPAYVASDGFDFVYEYALMDEEDSTIIYVILSYPDVKELNKYADYLKKDIEAYDIDSPTHDLFNIYDAQGWAEGK